ncbi:hypothetical protein BIY21_17240 [Vibrio ponticus]|uniref:Glycosyltransferase family 1 protein n=1 Tax=Vibrio ponticus TaxID=265668 RepID=A0ABX3FCY1_9VIBR|nr:glycosyltransferase family 1 protein [Vibrio ponticus]OLQ87302.1 hypothetical protein BIY21_17240 [Vibrio ponticus]
MKTIVINALSALRGGGQTYILNFIQHSPKNYKIVLLVSKLNVDCFINYESDLVEIHVLKQASKSIIHRTLWELFFLPRYLKDKCADVYYSPGGIMLSVIPKEVCSVTALRNMLPFDVNERKRFSLLSYSRFKLWLLKYIFLISYKKCDKVVFISHYSRDVVKGYMPEIMKKSTVIPHGLNELFFNRVESNGLPSGLVENGYYLYVSILDVYKAQKEVLKAWDILVRNGFKYPLILVGPKYNDYGDQVLSLISELNLEKHVIYLGHIDYDELPKLYQSARSLVFASSCECCPNILLEKLSSARPILCSNIQPMPEFGKESVIYFDPYEPTSLALAITDMEKKPLLMKELGERAYKQSLSFQWSKTVNDTTKFFFSDGKN